MTLRHLQIFASVYQNSSITKAAEELHLAQPSVSLAIKELEEHYGNYLFDRLNRRIYPTESGDRLYGYALHILSMFDEMEKASDIWGESGTLEVGTSITTGNYILPEIICSMKKAFPKININAQIKNSANIEKDILANIIDIGIIENESQHENIMKIPFLDDRLCVISPVHHELTLKKNVAPKELFKYDFIVREKGSAGRDILDSFMKLNNFTANIVLESVSTQAIVSSVEKGLGIAVLPYRLVENDIKTHRVEEIVVRGFNLSRKFNVIYHKNKYLTPPMEKFIELCKNSDKGE